MTTADAPAVEPRALLAARRAYDKERDALLEWCIDVLAAGSPGVVRGDVWRRLARMRQAGELLREYEDS